MTELPAGAASFAKHAERHGWDVRTAITTGPVPTTGKDQFVTAEIAAVWLDGHGFRAFATWERQPDGSASAQSWKWRCAAARPVGRPHPTWWSFKGLGLCKAFVLARGWAGSATVTDGPSDPPKGAPALSLVGRPNP